MRTKLLGLALVLIAVGVTTPASVHADDAEESRFHDALAREHYAAHRFEEALREFFEAARLAPSPRITFNIAVCFDLMHEENDAYLFFREYVDTDDQDPERRRFATEALARLGATVARVAITSDPEGSTIFVDQHDHGSYGTTPRVLALAPGPHTITLEREGFRPVTLSVEARRGEEVATTGSLTRIVGTLSLAASGVEGNVVVRAAGGADVARGPTPFETTLPPGLYEVELRSDGFRPFTSLVRVEADGRAVLDPTLEPLPPPTGDLTITANAAGAVIVLDGEPAGFAPTLLTELAVGEHRVRLEHPGLAPYEGSATITPESRGWLTVTLEEPARTTRSDATWIVGGAGIGGLVLGAVLGGLAIENHASFDRTQMDPMGTGLARIREQGIALNTATDVLLGVGAACLVTGVILYFATETTEARESRATFSEGER